MKIKHLTDQQLLKDIKVAVSDERKATLLVLEHIQEVHRRKLFAELGFSNLFKYLVKELGYSEGQAYRRIQAAKLVTDVPEVKVKIANGNLNLTNASKLQGFFNEQKVASDQKLALIAAVEQKSTRECEQVLLAQKQPDVERTFGLSLKLTENQKAKWDRLKGRLLHKKLSSESMLEQCVDLMLAQLEQSPSTIKSKQSKLGGNSLPQKRDVKKRSEYSRYVPVEVKRAVWQRAQGTCEWRGNKGERCDSVWGLEMDHRLDHALGGKTELTNLQLLCRGHHQRKSVQSWGARD